MSAANPPVAFARWNGIDRVIFVPADKGLTRQLTEAEALPVLGAQCLAELKADTDTWLSLYAKAAS